jgi:hypothetical protein
MTKRLLFVILLVSASFLPAFAQGESLKNDLGRSFNNAQVVRLDAREAARRADGNRRISIPTANRNFELSLTPRDLRASRYYSENETAEGRRQLEKMPVDYIEKIDAMGGMLPAIDSGYVQREIQEAAYTYQLAVEQQDAIVAGVNKLLLVVDVSIPILTVDPKIEREQVERLRAVREKRDAAKAESALRSLEDAASGTENLLPRILECVDSHVTVGEISNTLRGIWGEYQEAVTV